MCGIKEFPTANTSKETVVELPPKIDLRKSDLSPEQKGLLLSTLQPFSAVFSKGIGDLGRTNLYKHRIETGNQTPSYQRPYRLPQAQHEPVKKQLQEMIEAKVVQPSTSPWGSPLVVVKKKDGSDRLCVDYRRLNALTKKDNFPLPRIDETLDSLGHAKYFTTLDLQSAYWQMEIAERDIEKTAFTTLFGHFEFLVLPFGLVNGPSNFQRLMTTTLSDL